MTPSTPQIEARLNSLLTEYGGLIRQAILRTYSGVSSAELDDIEQDARMRLWKTLERETEINSPPSFVYRVSVTAALDAVRRVRRRREVPVDPDPQEETGLSEQVSSDVSPETGATQRETLDAVRQVMEEIPESRRRAVQLHLQGFTPSEIAELAGWTEPKARNLVYRGLNQLREQLDERGVTYDAE